MKKWLVFVLGFLAGMAVMFVALLVLALWFAPHPPAAINRLAKVSSSQGDAGIGAVLGSIRQKHHLPAVGGAILTGDGLKAMAVEGVRKKGGAATVTKDDVWHLGSDTKAMTATMIAALVEQGKLSWASTIGSVFPEITLPGNVKAITLAQLLTHRAGLPANADWHEIARAGGPLVEQRKAAVAKLASIDLLSQPGEKFSYSNWGYVVAGAMAEKAAGVPYEDLMRRIVFGPLGMTSVGFGPTSSADVLTEPWGHSENGEPNQVDNPSVMAPAGGVHCSLQDWVKFVADQLRGAEGKSALLKAESYEQLHAPAKGGDYAMGWSVTKRAWAGGTVYTHAGSNRSNMAVVWMSPARDIAYLVVCNQGASEKACDEIIGGLIALQRKASTANFAGGQ